jgi:hypothetical protein
MIFKQENIIFELSINSKYEPEKKYYEFENRLLGVNSDAVESRPSDTHLYFSY